MEFFKGGLMVKWINLYCQQVKFEYLELLKILDLVSQDPFNSVFVPQIMSHTIRILRLESEPEVLILGTLLLARSEVKLSCSVFNTYIQALNDAIFSLPLKEVLLIDKLEDPSRDEFRRVLKSFLCVGSDVRRIAKVVY